MVGRDADQSLPLSARNPIESTRIGFPILTHNSRLSTHNSQLITLSSHGRRSQVQTPRLHGLGSWLLAGPPAFGASPSARRRPARTRSRHRKGCRLRLPRLRREAAGPGRHPFGLDLCAVRGRPSRLPPVRALRHVRSFRVHATHPRAYPRQERAQRLPLLRAREVLRPRRIEGLEHPRRRSRRLR
jgi:hypothetical protein